MNFINPNIYYAFPQNQQPQINVYGNQQPLMSGNRVNIAQPIRQYSMKHVMSVEQIQTDTVPINGDPVFYSVGDTDVIYKAVWQNGGIQMSKFRIVPYEEEQTQETVVQTPPVQDDNPRLDAIEKAIALLSAQIGEISKRSETNESVVSKRESKKQPSQPKQEQ